MRLVLCDDHRLLLESLASTLAAHGHDIEAVTTSPEEAIAAVAAYDPDVCLLDVLFPHGDGLDAARAIAERHPRTRVLVLSGSSDPALVSAAIEAGVAGYTRKDQRIDSILRSLERVHAGEMVIDPDLLRGAIRRLSTPNGHGEHLLGLLTPREREALELIAHGRNTRQIAQTMRIAHSTARTHVQNVLAKLGAHSRLEAVTIANRAHGDWATG
jgi:two-component system nitrate/nitrite response regulator NarL